MSKNLSSTGGTTAPRSACADMEAEARRPEDGDYIPSPELADRLERVMTDKSIRVRHVRPAWVE